MRNVTNNFKIDLRTYGRQLDPKIKVNNEEFDVDNLNYIKPAFNTSLFKTIMHQVEIDSKVYMPKDTKIYIKLGIKVNEEYEYVEIGTYYVNSCERQEDTNSYRILAYTKMKDSMIDYDLTIDKEITVREYLVIICERLGWDTENIPTTFINSTKLVNPALHAGIKYTFRNALDEIATITCSFLLFKDDEFYLLYLNNTNETIDESYLDEDNTTIGEKYFINSLVFSRAEESDNIFRKDDSNITLNGLHEYRISDCQLLSTNNRVEYIDEMFEYLKTLEFYVFDIQTKGILFFEACDMFNLVLNGVTYPVVFLNDEINIEDGLTENLYVDEPEETETEYKYADNTDKKINQTYILVDKQNQKIESVVNSVTEQNDKISKVTQTVDELNSKIQDIADITIFGESMYAKVELDSINESEPIQITVKPTVENISYLYSNSGLYPSETLYPKVRTLRFTNKSLKENEEGEYIDFIFPDDLLIASDGTCDEFYLGYDEQICQVIKRCKYNEDGTVSKLDTEQIINYEYPKIQLKDGDYIIELLGYTNAYLGIRLMAQNIYTTQFATKAEVSSEINQTAQEIDLNVNKKLTSYSTTTEMNSAISMSANSITSNVSQTYATKTELTTAQSEIKQTTDSITSTVSKKVGEDEIISKINQSAEAVGIDANKIELSATDVLNLLAGNTINLSSKNIQISSTHLKIGKDGKLKILGDSSSTDLFRVENNSSTEFSYIMPVGAGFVGSNGRVDIYAENGDFGSSGIDVMDSDGTTTVRGKQIQTPGIKSQNIYSNNNVTSSANMYITSNGNVRRTTNTSSKRYKTDITNKISEELNPERLYDLEVKQFKYKEEYQPVKEDARYNQNLIGFIAEDVAKIFPIASDYEIDEQGNSYIENWNERYIVPAMLKLIQEQHKVQLMHEKQIAEQRLIIKILQEQLKE